MAGRKPKQTRDAQAGVTPLHGRRYAKGGPTPDFPNRGTRRVSGVAADGTWTPAFPGQRPPFERGSEVRLEHGARSPRRVGERAQDFIDALLDDEEMPPHLKAPQFYMAVRGWGRAEAIADLLWDWIEGQPVEAILFPKLGGTRAPVDALSAAMKTAAMMRAKLGLDPVSYARIAKDLGIARAAGEHALEQLAGTGAAIVSRRAELEQGS